MLILILILCVLGPTSAFPVTSSLSQQPSKKLHGRFLQINDLHLDSHYAYKSKIKHSCHFRKHQREEEEAENDWKDNGWESGSVYKEKNQMKAGYWGSPVSDCDSPETHINATFDFFEKHISSEIDFLVWTGDNARHDSDSSLPRNINDIFDMNRYIAAKVKHVFGDIPVISSIGNNDIYPHNIMYPGPSEVTSEYLSIWSHFIPEVERHTFLRGGYYAVEGIPNELLLISLNTIFTYKSNTAVDGCPYPGKGPLGPGREMLMWFEAQLVLARRKGMMVFVTGHVPPSKINWYIRCYASYSELVLRFHDIIIGQFYGHMNIDHFSFVQDSDINLLSSPSSPLEKQETLDPHIFAKTSPAEILQQYSRLPEEKDTDHSGFSLVNVNPSIIPTFLPAWRVWTFNTTRDVYTPQHKFDLFAKLNPFPSWRETTQHFARQLLIQNTPISRVFNSWTNELAIFKKKSKKPNHPPRLPRYFSPDSPVMTNRYLSLLGYVQFYLPLVDANKNKGYGPGKRGRRLLKERGEDGLRDIPQWEIEYTTFSAETLASWLLGSIDLELPIPLSLIGPEIKKATGQSQGNSTRLAEWFRTEQKSLVPYEMKFLGVHEWLKLARRLASSKKEWQEFLQRLVVKSNAVV